MCHFVQQLKLPQCSTNCKDRQPPPNSKVLKYISKRWIKGSTWPPSSWSVFKQAVRTNNDIEEWHNALNRHASGKCQLPFYLLINLLHKKQDISADQVGVREDGETNSMTELSFYAESFALWQEYKDGG